MPSMAALERWQAETPDLGFMVPDYHRLQLEHFIWTQSRKLEGGIILEVGAEFKRPYLVNQRYLTLNCSDPSGPDWQNEVLRCVTKPDLFADVTGLPFNDASVDCLIATETMEHVTDPVAAVRECYRVLRPGGLALFTTPFLWPYHGSHGYADYWRFTADGWRLLCRDFASVRVFPTEFNEGSSIQAVRDEERMGNPDEVRMATGYLVRAEKATSAMDQ